MKKEAANNTASSQREALINSFCEITSSSSKSEALFFLESHNFNLDSAVSTFLENNNTAALDGDNSGRPPSPSDSQQSNSPSHSENDSSSRSPSPRPSKRQRKRTSSSAYNLRSSRRRRALAGSGSDSDEYYTGGENRPRCVASAASVGGGAGSKSGGIHTFADLNQRPSTESGSDSEYEPQEYYTGGEKRILVQNPSKANDVDAIFNQARRYAAVEGPSEHLPSAGSRSFTGTARRLTGEAVSSVPQPPENVSHTITFWSNGFTVDDGPLRRFDDPENASLLESIRKLECPKELEPADTKTSVRVILTRKEENFRVPRKRLGPFQGVGRTLGSTSNAASVESTIAVLSIAAAPTSLVGPVVDQTQPSTSIQIRLGDGTRMVSQFNHQHTIRDIRGFIDASRPSGPRSYQLQTVGFPPKELAELDQTIEQAGLASSVVIQKL